jgi:putative membrane-bound dehydrogenase-like protein
MSTHPIASAVKYFGPLLWALIGTTLSVAQESTRGTSVKLKAGAYAKNVDPVSLPVFVSGGIVAGKAERIVDSLFARSIVLVNESADQSQTDQAVAICVVDSLGVPAWIVDKAKKMVSEQTPLKPHQVLISATHSHSAPALMGAHGTPAQEDYANQMPNSIAESIVSAYRNRTDAQVGYGLSNADRYIYCRRWIMEPGHAGGVLFSGRDSNIVAMNPGHDSPYKIRQTADVDRTIPFLSIKTIDGKPIALLASFCTHYAGAPALSSDYFGVVAKELAQNLRPEDPGSFVGIMANGTSGDANCIDFSRPAKPFDYHQVGSYVTSRILAALPSVEYSQTLRLNSKLESINAKVRQASDEELNQAIKYVDSKLADRLPANIEENYARETVLLSKMPSTRDVPLQALQIGNLAIVGYPTETYNATGLAVRAQSPFHVTLNIGLANDLLGYLPPADQFSLGGYTTWRARTSCLDESTESRVVDTLTKLLTELVSDSSRSDPVPQTVELSHDGPNTAISPVESLKHFEVMQGQRIELAAHEPNVIDPVAMRFDDAGNMWVVEMRDYPLNPGPQGLGRIRILKDSNHDGLFDQATVFAQGLLFPTGLQLHRDGALVTIGGKLKFLRDTNGDSVCDTSEDWLEGFAQENPQLRVNDPDFGIDGSLYLANGLRSSKIQILDAPYKSQATIASASEENHVVISNQDLRWNWLRNQGTPISGPSQFGMTWDRFGNRYFCTNRNPCDAVLLEPYQASLSPLVGLAPMTSPVLSPGEKSTVHPLVSAWTTSNLHAGQFTAACGVLISHSTHLPSASLGNVLTCEPTGSLVHRVGLGLVQGHARAEEPDRPKEWLASTDPWFRPVNLEEGPDGAIYVVDMHRAVIEHPDWVPEELKKRPDERWGDQCGRIYRVLRHDAPSVDELWRQLHQRPLSSRSSNELIDLVNHPRTWIQNTATRLLYERIFTANPDQIHLLQEQLQTALEALAQAKETSGSLIRLLYLCDASRLPNRVEVLQQPLIEENHPSHHQPALRVALWRFATHAKLDSELLTQAAKRAIRSGAPEEATEAAWYMAQMSVTDDQSFAKKGLSDNQLIDWCVARSVDLADDPYWLMAVTALHRNDLTSLVSKWMQQATSDLDEKKMVRTFSTTAWTRLTSAVGNPENGLWLKTREDWQSNLSKLLLAGPGDDETHRRIIKEPQLSLQLAIASGIAKSADRNWFASQSNLWEGFEIALRDDRWSDSLRGSLGQILGLSITPDQSRRSCEALRVAVSKTIDPTLKRQFLVAWSQHPDELASAQSCLEWMLERFESETPAMRNAIFQAIRSRPERMARWLDAIESGSITDKGLDASQIQSLAQIAGELQPRIAKWLAGRVRSDRSAVVQQYLSCLELKVDMNRGKELFAKQCAACHRIDGVGSNVGPDISDSRTQTAQQLLASILDPNRAIDNNYFRISVQMQDGTIHDGIAIEESAEHLILKNQQSTRLLLDRKEIETIKPSGVSLMPEGIEVQLDQQSMADLIGYIKNWRYVGGAAPQPPQITR